MTPSTLTTSALLMLTLLNSSGVSSPSPYQAASIPSFCSNQCTGPIELRMPNGPDLNVTNNPEMVTLTVAPQTTPSTLLRLRRYSEVCPNGFMTYSNDACKTKTIVVEPQVADVHAAINHNQCLIGPVCPPNANSCDSDGVINCEENVPRKTRSPKRQFTMNSNHRRNMLTMACVQDWECTVKPVQLPIYLEYKSSTLVVYAFNGDNDKFIITPSSLTLNTDSQGYTIIVHQFELKIDPAAIVNCLQRDNSKLCITTESRFAPKGIVLKMQEDCSASFQNYLVFGPCPNSHTSPQSPSEGGAANLHQLQAAFSTVQFEQLQSQYNTLEVVKNLQSTQEVILNLLNELGSYHPLLLGRVLKVGGITKQIDGNHKVQCKCSPPLFKESLCDGNYYLDQGNIRERTSNDQCHRVGLHYNESDKFNIHLFKALSLSLDLLATLNLTTSIKEEIAKLREVDFSGTSDADPSSLTFWSWLQSKAETIKSYISWIGCAMSWMTFLSYFFSCLRRPRQVEYAE